MEKEIFMINKLIILLGQYFRFGDEAYKREFNMLFKKLCEEENLSPTEIFGRMFGDVERSFT